MTFEGAQQHITLTHGTSWGSYYRHVNISDSMTSNSLHRLRTYYWISTPITGYSEVPLGWSLVELSRTAVSEPLGNPAP
jgi:hypothetical protein